MDILLEISSCQILYAMITILSSMVSMVIVKVASTGDG